MIFLDPRWKDSPEDLRARGKESADPRTYERLLAIALLKEGANGWKAAEVVGRHYTTITRWVTTYNKGGVENLHYKGPPGNVLWLSELQLQQLKAAVQQEPAANNLQGVQWTYRQVIQFCSQEFGIVIKERTAQKYLNILGFVRKRPKQRYVQASDEKKKLL